MNRKTIGLGVLVLILGVTATSAGSALAYRGDPATKGPQYSEERHALMTKAFENNDYAAWKELMQNRGRVTQVITEANFAKLAEAHKLVEEGKLAEAREIRQELGLGLRNGSGREWGRGGMGRGCNQ